MLDWRRRFGVTSRVAGTGRDESRSRSFLFSTHGVSNETAGIQRLYGTSGFTFAHVRRKVAGPTPLKAMVGHAHRLTSNEALAVVERQIAPRSV